ncbi:protein shisa-6-like protein [Nothobranchius furzeri]|uniref:Protein shisa-6-like protein n=1 Tax=Nothobranchius furzeri TaxID=105023 RepID=A0A9D3BJY3_NOTFU|nr:protein shisa-6-like protein [Nothobranchius furzeri]
MANQKLCLRPMETTVSKRIFSFSIILLLFYCLPVSTVTLVTERRAADNDVRTLGSSRNSVAVGKISSTLFLLTGYKPPVGSIVAPKTAEMEDGDDPPAMAELPQKPLPQTMLRKNHSKAMLDPPFSGAQVAPAPKQLVNVDTCKGYFDVMGHFDNPFNCTKDSYIYCCGTCQYRFCCEHQGQRLDQNSCTNYKSPIWAQTQVPVTLPPGNKPDLDFETLQHHSSSTAYVIGGVISFTLVVAVGVRIVFSKVARRPRNRDINVPRSLVDILRHQSSPMQHGERNNATMLTTTTSDGRTSKSLYTPILQMKENRTGTLHHPFKQQGSASSPKHSATIEHGPRMNNTSQLSSGPTLISGSGKGTSGVSGIIGGSMRHNNSHPSFSHSFHNLAQLPPSYETVMKPEINRYSSLKKLANELNKFFNRFSSGTNPASSSPAPSQSDIPSSSDPTFSCHTPALLSSNAVMDSSGSINPSSTKSGDAAAPFNSPSHLFVSRSQVKRQLERLNRNKAAVSELFSLCRFFSYLLTTWGSRSHERLLVSPDRLDDRLMMMGMPVAAADRGAGSGMFPTMGRLSHHQKAQSQQNICVTPSMDRHHMIKMNSHPTSGHEHERSSAAVPGMGIHSGWDSHGGHSGGGVGTTGGHPNARRMAFATKRQNTIEQLHFIPGGGGGQGLRTGSKNEVTV